MMRVFLLFLIVTAISRSAFSQMASVYGNVRDETGQSLGSVSIKIFPGGKGVITDQKGSFDFEIPADKKIILTFSHIGYDDFVKEISLHTGQRFPLYVVMNSKPYMIDSITIEDKDVRNEPSMVKIDPKKFESLPSAGGGVEAILKVMGAQSNNEMSSQYSVRGGNYDENLV